MRDELRALVKLAEIDALARDLEVQIEGIPAELEERRQAMQALEALLGGQKAQLDEAVALLAHQEGELKSRNDMLARSRGKGAKARTMREAEMAEREVESVRRSIRDGETEKERLEGLIEQTRATLSEPLEELASQKAALEEAEQGLDERLAALKADRDKITEGREEYAKLLPKRIVRRYDRVRGKLHPLVVPAVKGVCRGCRMELPPQLFNDLQKADSFYQCPHCNRYVYYPPALDLPMPDDGPNEG